MNIHETMSWILMWNEYLWEVLPKERYTKDAKICHKRKVLTKYSFKRYSHLPIFYLKTRIVLSFPPIVTLITRTKHFQRKLQNRSPWQTNELDSRVMRICESIRGSLGFPNNFVCIYSIGIRFIGILFDSIWFYWEINQVWYQRIWYSILFRDTRFRNGSTFIVNF